MRMGHHHHPTRREVLESIPLIGAGSLLLPANLLRAQKPDTETPGIIRGSLRDARTGAPVAAKVRVTNTASGESYLPESAIKTMPQRTQPDVRHYFYARGDYEAAVPPGRYRYRLVVDGNWVQDPYNSYVESNPFGELNNVVEVEFHNK